MNPIPIMLAQFRVVVRAPWMILFAPVVVLIALITGATMLLVGSLRAVVAITPRKPGDEA
jgi:hypothetical protein